MRYFTGSPVAEVLSSVGEGICLITLTADGLPLLQGVGYGTLTPQVELGSGQHEFRATAGSRQTTQIVLAGQVAEQGDDAAMHGGDAHGGRDVAVDAAGTTVGIHVQSLGDMAGKRV